MKLTNLQTQFIGKDFRYFDVLDSTQNEIKRLDKKQITKNGTLVYAEVQTAAIGTHERKWYTSKGNNLAFTFVLYPNCNIQKMENITIILAESLVQTIKELYGYELQIKEPNDIVFLGKKLGGILTESITEGEMIKKIFVGIGFNVNQDKFPGNLDKIATSLKKMFDGVFVREDILIRFLEIFEKRYLELL